MFMGSIQVVSSDDLVGVHNGETLPRA